MSRTARQKNGINIHHIMSRGISEIILFKDSNDKEKFLNLLKKYKKAYMIKIYSYIIMDTHYHLQINDNGADISKFMKSINQSYAQYYNKRYNRHGHVFADRFKSKPIQSDRYAVVVSLYIHNNPKDISKYRNCINKYKYSSIHAYLNKKSPKNDLIDTDFILNHFSLNRYEAAKNYLGLILNSSNKDIEDKIELLKKEYTYVKDNHILVRNFKPEKIIDFIKYFTKKTFCINGKYNHKNMELKSLCVFLLRCLCNFKLNDISNIIGNISNSNTLKLYENGLFLVSSKKYKNIINNFISYSKSSQLQITNT
ncbi:transposase [Clostridium tyrobutyricum]|uniref:transposase n=1 Tax=Clostridium tyrobutyricum TaxID=1519 RepID=UPI00057CA5DA|nr:transposase [Clostridium tyrobutyricum]